MTCCIVSVSASGLQLSPVLLEHTTTLDGRRSLWARARHFWCSLSPSSICTLFTDRVRASIQQQATRFQHDIIRQLRIHSLLLTSSSHTRQLCSVPSEVGKQSSATKQWKPFKDVSPPSSCYLRSAKQMSHTPALLHGHIIPPASASLRPPLRPLASSTIPHRARSTT